MTYRDAPVSKYYFSDVCFVNLDDIVEMTKDNGRWVIVYRHFGQFSFLTLELGNPVWAALRAYRNV